MRHLIFKVLVVAVAFGLGEHALSVEPVQKPSTESMTVAQLEAAGDLARSQKDYAEAIKFFDAALRKEPKNAVLYNKLGLAELKTDDLTAARIDFQKAAKHNSKYSDAINNLGAISYLQKNYGAAAKQFKKAVALNETRAVFHVNLGAAWFGQKKLERAIAEYARALELDPDALTNSANAGIAAQIASPEERAKYQYMLAKIYAKRGNTEECLRCLKIAKEQGYKDMQNVYKDEEFTNVRKDSRLTEIVPPPAK
ncbi:MAG TPA: tetratricopeptide repeat protein [Terriglobales bacterium]|nr:tetratricopeptide repeat protein [Terriglobales bacterium]